MKSFVIGDIHGALKALQQVLERANVPPGSQLIFLGDYVDGWSESAQVISYLINLSAATSCRFIKGNHDVWCEEWLRTGYASEVWLQHGGRETIHSYRDTDEATKRVHLRWLEQMNYYERDENDRLFIHAGFTSMHGPEREFVSGNFTWDRTLWEMALALDTDLDKDSLRFPKRLKLFSEIFIGHTPTLYYNAAVPMRGCNVWNVDTGAAFRGKLTIMDIDTKAYWQSDPVWTLYPDEKGRN